MDFGFSGENEALRDEVRKFIRENTSPELLAELKASTEGHAGPLVAALRQRVADKGWLAMSWPPEYGGLLASRGAACVRRLWRRHGARSRLGTAAGAAISQ